MAAALDTARRWIAQAERVVLGADLAAMKERLTQIEREASATQRAWDTARERIPTNPRVLSVQRHEAQEAADELQAKLRALLAEAEGLRAQIAAAEQAERARVAALDDERFAALDQLDDAGAEAHARMLGEQIAGITAEERELLSLLNGANGHQVGTPEYQRRAERLHECQAARRQLDAEREALHSRRAEQRRKATQAAAAPADAGIEERAAALAEQKAALAGDVSRYQAEQKALRRREAELSDEASRVSLAAGADAAVERQASVRSELDAVRATLDALDAAIADVQARLGDIGQAERALVQAAARADVERLQPEVIQQATALLPLVEQLYQAHQQAGGLAAPLPGSVPMLRQALRDAMGRWRLAGLLADA